MSREIKKRKQRHTNSHSKTAVRAILSKHSQYVSSWPSKVHHRPKRYHWVGNSLLR
jgi:hypothetical protein